MSGYHRGDRSIRRRSCHVERSPRGHRHRAATRRRDAPHLRREPARSSERTGVLERASDEVKALDLTTALWRARGERSGSTAQVARHRQQPPSRSGRLRRARRGHGRVDRRSSSSRSPSWQLAARRRPRGRSRIRPEGVAAPQPPRRRADSPNGGRSSTTTSSNEDERLRDHTAETRGPRTSRAATTSPGTAGSGTPTIVSRFWSNAPARRDAGAMSTRRTGPNSARSTGRRWRPVEGPTYDPARLRRPCSARSSYLPTGLITVLPRGDVHREDQHTRSPTTDEVPGRPTPSTSTQDMSSPPRRKVAPAGTAERSCTRPSRSCSPMTHSTGSPIWPATTGGSS